MKHKIMLPIIALSLISASTLSAAATNSDNVKPTANAAVSAPQTENDSNPIEIILKDHQHIRQVIAELNKQTSSNIDKSKEMFKSLKDFLVKHETMEQKLWYPELEKKENLKPIIAALIKEEEAAGALIKKVEDSKDAKEWESNFKTLAKAVEHHATEEETKLFPKVKQEVDKSTLNAIGAKLKEYHNSNNMKY